MAWIVHHDSVYGGRVPLPDSILIEQAKTIAAEANLDFDPVDFNFSSKWLYKFKMHNNIKHTNLHGEGEAADLTSVAIVRYCRLFFMFFMMLLLVLLLLLLLLLLMMMVMLLLLLLLLLLLCNVYAYSF